MKKTYFIAILIVIIAFVLLNIFRMQIFKFNNKSVSDDEILVKYGLLSSKEVNPFENIDFNKRIIKDNSLTNNNINFNSSSITYEAIGEDVVTIEVNEVKQVGLACHCSYCYAIYYLLDNGELYKINLEEGKLISDEDGTFNTSTIKLENNVEVFDLLKDGLINEETCGGYSLIYKDKQGNQYIKYDELDKSYELSKYERLWVKYTGFDSTGDSLYIVSNNVPVEYYITNEKGEILKVKELYVFFGDIEPGSDDIGVNLYILNEDNYLYYLEKSFVNNQLAKLYKNSKVSSILEDGSNIIVKYEDESIEEITAYLEYK
jgi:hypothetical protein